MKRFLSGEICAAGVQVEIPVELASSAVFPASNESSFITGIDLPVDGGTASR